MDYLLAALVLTLIASNFLIYFIQSRRPGGTDEGRENLQKDRDRLFEDNARLQSESAQKSARIGEIERELKEALGQKDRLSGEFKTQSAQLASAEAEIRMLRQEAGELKKTLQIHEANILRIEKEHDAKLQQLEHARQSFDDEKARIRREDETRQAALLEEQNRIWDTHEKSVQATLRDLCQKPELAFLFYENSALPTEFDGSFKPDFLIEFLGQYIIFDAKCSRSDLDTYIKAQVKSTAEKVRGKANIFPVLFFVVPTRDLAQLKKTAFVESEVSFFVIPPEALAPLLANFRKVADFAHLSELDPRDRDQIVSLIANYDQHIAFQNAANLLFARQSKQLNEAQEALDPELFKAIGARKQQMRPIKLKETELKRLAGSLDAQETEINALIEPRPQIGSAELKTLMPLFQENP